MQLQEWSLSSHSQPIRQIVIADRGTFGLPGNVESDQRFCFCQDEKFFVTSVQRRGLLCQVGVLIKQFCVFTSGGLLP